jgi:O-antigen/teichoic acid export membrane protein
MLGDCSALNSLIRMLIIPGALTVALFPRITALISVDLNAAKKLYSKATTIVTKIFAPILLIITLSSHVWLSVWLGVEFADKAWVIASILSIGIFFNRIAQIPHAIIQAKGDTRLTALIHLTEFVLYTTFIYRY